MSALSMKIFIGKNNTKKKKKTLMELFHWNTKQQNFSEEKVIWFK